MNNILETLKTIRPEEDFEHSENFVEDGLLDSFDIVTLVASLDKAHGISIDGADIVPENFNSVAAIEALLHKNGARP